MEGEEEIDGKGPYIKCHVFAHVYVLCTCVSMCVYICEEVHMLRSRINILGHSLSNILRQGL